MMRVLLSVVLFGACSAWSAGSAPACIARRSATDAITMQIKAGFDKNYKKRRESALVTGTNWPPRTPPEPGKGYLFFQGPTPKTAYQKDLPSFFSAENFADVEIKPISLALTATGFGSLALILAGLNGAFDTGAAPPKPAPAKVE